MDCFDSVALAGYAAADAPLYQVGKVGCFVEWDDSVPADWVAVTSLGAVVHAEAEVADAVRPDVVMKLELEK